MPARKMTPIIGPKCGPTIKPKLARRCPRCDAGPGHSCGRWNNLGFWVSVKTLHRER